VPQGSRLRFDVNVADRAAIGSGLPSTPLGLCFLERRRTNDAVGWSASQAIAAVAACRGRSVVVVQPEDGRNTD
jgi:hypothetical protein